MDDISKEAGISKKTIYNFIPNKADLIQKVVEIFIKKEQEEINNQKSKSSNALDEMINITEHILQYLRKLHPSLIYDLRKYYKSSWNIVEEHHFDFIRNCICDNLIRGKKEGVYRDEIDEEVISRLYMQSSRQMNDDSIFPISEFPKVPLFEKFIEYHMYGILNEQGLKKYKKNKNRS